MICQNYKVNYAVLVNFGRFPFRRTLSSAQEMFGKKLQRADYSGGVNVLTLCCGFLTKRKDSDELPKSEANGEASVPAMEGGGGEEREGALDYDQISEKNNGEKVRKKKVKTKVDENGKDMAYFLFLFLIFFLVLFSSV